MGKRSDFERSPRDLYRTIDPRAALRLHKHLKAPTTFSEPCCGAGDLIVGLTALGHKCLSACDIEPLSPCEGFPSNLTMQRKNCLDLTPEDVVGCDLIVTNPPFRKDMLLPMIDHFMSLKDTWLLLPSDICHNVYMAPYMNYCSDILAIGRMYWQENKVSGKDNMVWLRFSKNHIGRTAFHGRV